MITKSQAKLFKNALFAHLDNHIKRNAPFHISWECHYCDEKHSKNLLENIARVEMDYDATIAQPHLALLDEKENIVIAIHIPSKKLPAGEYATIYTENDIIYIQLLPEKNSSPDNIGEELHSPSFVSLCFNPACPHCGNHMHKKQIIVATIDCWHCKSNMKFAYWTAGGRHGTPADFDVADIELAASKGVHFSIQHSPIQNEYYANTCTTCGSFMGDMFVHDYYGSVPAETFEAGYHCMNCNQPVFDMNQEPDNDDDV